MTFPDLKTIPKHYFKPSDRPGTLESLTIPLLKLFPTRQAPQFQLKRSRHLSSLWLFRPAKISSGLS